MGVGGAQEGKSREQVEEDVARHNFETNLPEDKLARFTNQVRGQYGGSTSSQGSSLPTLYSNPGGQALGLATSLASAIPLIADGVT